MKLVAHDNENALILFADYEVDILKEVYKEKMEVILKRRGSVTVKLTWEELQQLEEQLQEYRDEINSSKIYPKMSIIEVEKILDDDINALHDEIYTLLWISPPN